MKSFFKTLGCGLAAILISLVTVAMIVAAIKTLFVELPAATGMLAVGKFLLAILWLVTATVDILILGCGLIAYEGG